MFVCTVAVLHIALICSYLKNKDCLYAPCLKAKLIMTAHIADLNPSLLIRWYGHSWPGHIKWLTMLQTERCSRKVVNNCFCVSSCRRQPCLILTNVLETEQGKAYMERITQSPTSRKCRRGSSKPLESGRSKEDPLICRDRRSSQKEADKNRSQTPKSNQKTKSPLSQR